MHGKWLDMHIIILLFCHNFPELSTVLITFLLSSASNSTSTALDSSITKSLKELQLLALKFLSFHYFLKSISTLLCSSHLAFTAAYHQYCII